LPAAVRAACRIGASAERFAEETLRLLSLTPNERRTLAARADMDELSWEAQLGPLRHLLTDSRQHQAVAV
jgi:hypothetical protein